jgi:large subunit ribosomal protein L6
VSRIGRLPIPVPAGVKVEINGVELKVKGPKGEIGYSFPPLIEFNLEAGVLQVVRKGESAEERSMHGTARAVANNMVKGVSTGWERKLEVNGVGYRAEMSGKNLMLYVGYSHPVVVEPVEGISFEVDAKTRQVKVLGYDKELVGQISANIRSIRPPEPYHGKGIHYLGEKIRSKAGKSGKGKGKK